MAKLEGVKTLDMVNGEITKVAYGGAAYERVEGEAKAGDIVRLVDKEDFHSTPGGFYDVIAGGRSAVCVLDDYGAHHNWTEGWYELFRKVAANTNPSVEDRVTKAEGEIESLKSDVAALKGGAEYKRIDADEAKVGDYVKYIDSDYLDICDYSFTIGKLYEIKALDEDEDFEHEADNGERLMACPDDEELEFYRKVSASSVETEPKPERLKVGDYAKVVNADQPTMGGFSVGDIVEIVESEYGEHDVDFYVMSLAGGNSGYIRKTPEYIVRATDEEVAEAKDAAARAKFKRGDKVRLKSGGEKFPLSGFSDGGVYTVMYNDFNHSHGKRIRIADGTEGFGYATPDQLEILSEEEAAEHKKWAEIGREVGEYKKGDIVRYDYGDNEICEVVDDTEGGRVGVQTKDYGICREKPDTLRLITPVEARFDR
ncbi:hypothetical protein ACFWA2_14400 [Bacillus subtilis]